MPSEWGKDDKEHDENLSRVLSRCHEVNLRLNINKCRFKMDKVSYVGDEFTKDGLRPNKDKIKAIKERQRPEDNKLSRDYLVR